MCSGTTSPGRSTRPRGNSPSKASSALVIPRHHDRLQHGLGACLGLVAELREVDDHAVKIDEVEVEGVGLGVGVDECPGDLRRLSPAELHACLLYTSPSPRD